MWPSGHSTAYPLRSTCEDSNRIPEVVFIMSGVTFSAVVRSLAADGAGVNLNIMNQTRTTTTQVTPRSTLPLGRGQNIRKKEIRRSQWVPFDSFVETIQWWKSDDD